MGYVAHGPCPDRAGAERYFHRAGLLLALSYVLRSTDFHFENLIARGEYPMLVDLEVLTSAFGQDLAFGRTEAERLAEYYLGDSVLISGLLPFWGIGPTGHTIDRDGLDSLQNQRLTDVVWRGANTDGMHLVYETRVRSAADNTPVLDSAPLPVSDFEDDVVHGFREMYRYLAENGSRLLQACAPLQALKRLKVRTVLRATDVYATLMAQSRHPKFLRDGVAYELHFEQLARVFVSSNTIQSEFWPLFAEEKRASMALDIPYFSMAVDDGALYLSPSASISKFMLHPSWDRLVARLDGMPDDARIQQETIIRATLTSSTIDGPPSCPAGASATDAAGGGVPKPAPSDV